MEVKREYISGADTAKLIRKALKAAFPGVKFSVRLSRGSATYVSWKDGPTRQQVCEITYRFEGQTFNSSEDMRESRSEWALDDDGAMVIRHYGSGLVIEQRSWSDSERDRLIAENARIIDGRTGQPLCEREAGDFAWRDFCETDYTTARASV